MFKTFHYITAVFLFEWKMYTNGLPTNESNLEIPIIMKEASSEEVEETLT